ncbi:MAG: nuclear transport factor 2 family protein [Gammaproteobacteria bacterium]
MDVQAIEKIKRVKYRYSRCMDTGDLKGVKDCFTEDASLCLVGGTYRFEVEGRNTIMEAFAAAVHEGIATSHVFQHPEIDLVTGETATGIWYLSDWGLDLTSKIRTQGTAICRDRYRRVGDDWKIEHYGYTRIYEQIDELAAVPNITAHAVADARREQIG